MNIEIIHPISGMYFQKPILRTQLGAIGLQEIT